MTEQDRHQKRRHFRGKPRPGCRVDVGYRPAGGDGPMAAAVTRNLGVGGAFILTDRPEPTGTTLEIHIRIPSDPDPVVVSGEVRWTTPAGSDGDPGMGVVFVDVPVDGVLRLSEYFASLTGSEA
jgi:uncharacterized protein (TIGR02266 family)